VGETLEWSFPFGSYCGDSLSRNQGRAHREESRTSDVYLIKFLEYCTPLFPESCVGRVGCHWTRVHTIATLYNWELYVLYYENQEHALF
jgi:hypothetical protein